MCSHILGGVRYFESYITDAYWTSMFDEHAMLAVVDYSNTISQAK